MAISSQATPDLPGLSHHKHRPSSPLHSHSLSHVLIAEALLKSDDGGATLDLGHKALTDVGEYGAEELATIGREQSTDDESSVLRINLGSNRLAALPMAFALLSSLRYLNLRNNCFSVFPDVLTIMPSLEILEIGRNKIKRLPTQPGSLLNLRIFSFYKNKITRLPSYFVQFARLEVLRAEQNPFEWPPKSVVESQPNMNMRDYIQGVQRWIEDNSPSVESRRHVEEPVFSPTIFESPIDDFVSPLRDYDDDGRTPHARSFSVSSETSHYNSELIPSIPRAYTSAAPSSSTSRHRPLHLTLPPSSSASPSASPSHSPDSYLPTPVESVSSTDDEIPGHELFKDLAHSRNVSYSGSVGDHSLSGLKAKKSLPELRPTKLRLGDEESHPALADSPILTEAGSFSLRANKSVDQFAMPSPVSNRQDSSESSESSHVSRTAKQPVHDPSSSPASAERPAPSIESERHSYFRRYSTVPASTLSKIVPNPLLRLVDSVRGILFAVSQVHQALQHYTVYAIDERLAAVLLKVLDPASAYIGQLINALDRFDSMSRRSLPTPAVCRAVIESCRDNVTVFGKAVGVLALQLKVLATRDDDRYTRQMLLVLYGASAEISNAWKSMVPHFDVVAPLLRDLRPTFAKKSRTPPSTTPLDAVPSTPKSTLPSPRSSQRNPDSPARTHIARRHAGSFSSKDVEIGKSLPSFTGFPILQGGLAAGAETPTPRAALRQASIYFPMVPSPVLSSAVGKSPLPWSSHSRQGSQSSLRTSSAGSTSPLTPSRIGVPETPSDLTTLVDKEAIEAMTKAVDAAPPIWAMMETILGDVGGGQDDVRETLARAQSVTASLKEGIAELLDGSQHTDRRAIREIAHLFVKFVVQLSSSIKTYGLSHPLSPVLRANMVKLTNATEEFVILLHVSSFSSGSGAATLRPHTPLTGAFVVSSSDAIPRLGATLSRSRSAAAPSSRLVAPLPEVPRSALPSQSFKVSTPPRRPRRDDTIDVF
ncbi:RAM signaling pathway protein-domain-containing protein [Amylostereum chailletii]|nr:RAM signaling pathway protein-domain-containing protein [Amylostereum chailletii]